MSLTCDRCGAPIEYAAGIQSMKCSFCGAVNEIKDSEEGTQNYIVSIIPLLVTQNDLEICVLELIASVENTPDDMLISTRIIKKECWYIPVYQFEVEYTATWTASFGFHHTEYYAGKSGKRESVVNVDWKPQNGIDSGLINIHSYCGTELHDDSLDKSSLIDHAFSLGKIKEFNSAYIQGIRTEGIAISESTAFDMTKEMLNSLIERNVIKHAQGDTQRDWHFNATHSHKTKAILIPICHAIFDYKGEEFQLWADGVNSKMILATELPVSDEKKYYLFYGFLPACLALTSILYRWSDYNSLPNTRIGVLLSIVVFIIFGFIFKCVRNRSILKYSKRLRESLLTQIKLSTRNVFDTDSQSLVSAYQSPKQYYFSKSTRGKFLVPVLCLIALISVGRPSYFSKDPSNGHPKSFIANLESKSSNFSSIFQSTPTTTSLNIDSKNPASPFIQEIIEYAADFDRVQLNKIKIENLAKPPKGDRKQARKLNDQALSLINQDNRIDALPILESAYQADSGDSEIANNLASVYIATAKNNDMTKAKGMLVESLALKPDRTYAWRDLGRAFALEGNEKSAMNCFVLFYKFSKKPKIALQNLVNPSDDNPLVKKAMLGASELINGHPAADFPQFEKTEEAAKAKVDEESSETPVEQAAATSE